MHSESELREILRAFEAKGIGAVYAADKEEALSYCLSLLKPGFSVACSGSATLGQIGLHQALRDADVEFIEVSRNLSPEERHKLHRKCHSSDVFFSGTNAITRTGEIVNIDGYGNRVSAHFFGPHTIVIVAGYNKVTGTLNEALYRVKNIAAPLNVRRLRKSAPCGESGLCTDCSKDEGSICSYVSVIVKAGTSHRTILVLVNEKLGF